MGNNKGKILKIRTGVTYQVFCNFYRTAGVYPTMAEMAAAIALKTGYCSPNSVRKYLMVLADEGLIEYIPGRVHPFRFTAKERRELMANAKPILY